MSLLFICRPLVVNPALATRLGLNEAILLQQVHYWLTDTAAGVEHDGKRWIYNTLEGWHEQFPFMSLSTIKRGFASLKKQGVLRIEQLSEDKHNKTNYYSIDYAAPAITDGVKLTPSNGSDWTDGTGQIEPMEQVKLTPSNGSDWTDVTETTTENTHINPIQSARGELVEAERPVPDYAGQPGTLFPASRLMGKFPMSECWTPGPDFRRQAALWGRPVPEGVDLRTELNNFIAYWIPEGKVFHQTQWEQKFASQLQRAKSSKPRGNSHAELDADPTLNAAQRRTLAAREAQRRARGQSLDVLGAHGGNLLQPLGDQKRIGTVGPMDCSDWEFDQRPDDERL